MIRKRKVLPWVLLVGGAAHGALWSRVLGLVDLGRPLYWLSWLSVAALLWWWPLPSALARPGWRGLLMIAPLLSTSLVGGTLGNTLLLGTAWSALVLWLWKDALATAALTSKASLNLFVATVIGGPMGAALLSPLIVDSTEAAECFDLSRFQRILITRSTTSTQLWLDGNRQVSSADERSYHEALVRPAMSHRPKRVLILGGGDGLAAREVLQHQFVTALTMVELDGRVPALVRRSSLGPLTGSAFDDPRLALVEADGIGWLDRNPQRFDAIIVDFPDPTTRLLAGLFAVETWQRIKDHLEPGGRCTLQSCSLLYPEIVGSIAQSIRASGLNARVYSREVASFGAHAFVLASAEPVEDHSLQLHAAAHTIASTEALRELMTVVVAANGFVISQAKPATLRALAELTRPR